MGRQNTSMQTLLVDDHSILLEGITQLLLETDGFEVFGTATSLKEATEFLKKQAPQLIITDYSLPDGSGLSLIKIARNINPGVKIIMLSIHDEPHLVKEVLKEGVDGYILKKDPQQELKNALHAVKTGKIYLSSDISAMLVHTLNKPGIPELLTPREREILKLISREYSNKEIGKQLFISERTVETHRKNIFRKTKTKSIVGLIKFAYTNNLI